MRLGISWSALEPERGELDAAYVAQIQDAVGWAKEHGIYVVLDMHQDSWWNGATPEGTACRPGTDPMWGYDGAPEWATITDGAPRCQFQGRDISPASDRAFQNFYFDTDGVQSAFDRTCARARGDLAMVAAWVGGWGVWVVVMMMMVVVGGGGVAARLEQPVTSGHGCGGGAAASWWRRGGGGWWRARGGSMMAWWWFGVVVVVGGVVVVRRGGGS